MDISESGSQIGEKLFTLLDAEQRRELRRYVTKEKADCDSDILLHDPPAFPPMKTGTAQPLTEMRFGSMYFCLENRTVRIGKEDVALTAKEFDIFALLVMNPGRVFTYEMITDTVWHEAYDYCSRKAVNNHISNLRKKLGSATGSPDYIQSIHGVGYRFNPNKDTR